MPIVGGIADQRECSDNRQKKENVRQREEDNVADEVEEKLVAGNSN